MATNFLGALTGALSTYGGFSATVSDDIVTVTTNSPYSYFKVFTSGSSPADGGPTGSIAGLAITSSGTTINNDTFVHATGSAFAATGTLAAVWYLDAGTVQLDGNDLATGSVAQTGSGIFLRPVENGTFKAIVKNGTGTTVARTSFNFSSTSGRFIRKQFNTNPTLTNSDITSDSTNYWLGESYEGSVKMY